MNNSDQPGGSRCRLLALTALIGLGMATAGCEEPKEKVLDVDARASTSRSTRRQTTAPRWRSVSTLRKQTPRNKAAAGGNTM